MSYILEALRKSDQQRNRGATPTLFGGQEATVVRRRTAFILYGVLAVALIGAGIAIGVLRPWQTPQADMADRAPIVVRSPVAAPAPAVAPPTQSKPPDAIAPMPATPAPDIATAPRAEPKPKPTARPKRRVDRPIRKSETAVADQARTDAAPESRAEMPAAEPANAEAPATEAANAEPVSTMAELPASIRDELPKIKITVHAYSSRPASRIVGYENRILREGDYLVPGLKLEEITRDGMILSFKGYRFSRGAN
ncbi:MAG: general secretion pathway protein GspB [Betaproteobacteria bacterium]